MARTTKYLLTSLISVFLFLSAKADKLARIKDKDGFTYIRDSASKDSKIVGTINQNDFFYCNQSKSEWWKVTTLKWDSNGNQIAGFIHRSRVQIIETLQDTAKKKIFLIILNKQKQLADIFRNSDSSTHFSKVKELENYSDTKYTPMLGVFANYFCETKDSITLYKWFATLWADRGSASEEPSFALGDCFACYPDIILRQIKKIKDIECRNLIANDIEWGLRNKFNVPEEGLGIPENTNKKEIEQFKKLKHKLDRGMANNN